MSEAMSRRHPPYPAESGERTYAQRMRTRSTGSRREAPLKEGTVRIRLRCSPRRGSVHRVGGGGGPSAGAAPALIGPYFGAAFTIQHNSYAFGQAASWSTGGRVLSAQLDSAGLSQIYRSDLDGRPPAVSDMQDCPRSERLPAGAA